MDRRQKALAMNMDHLHPFIYNIVSRSGSYSSLVLFMWEKNELKFRWTVPFKRTGAERMYNRVNVGKIKCVVYHKLNMKNFQTSFNIFLNSLGRNF